MVKPDKSLTDTTSMDDPDEVVQFHLPASVKRKLEAHARTEGFRAVSQFQRTYWTKFLRDVPKID